MNENNLFYKLDDDSQGLPRQLAPGFNTRIFVGDKAMLSIVAAEPGAKGEVHSHPEEQWGFLFEGSGVRFQNGQEIPVKAGDFWRTPGGVPHGFVAGPEGARILDIFSPPRKEYQKSGEGFS